MNRVEIDLILKGIKTLGRGGLVITSAQLVEIDLILKGIKTHDGFSIIVNRYRDVEIDLILKGIKTVYAALTVYGAVKVEIDLILKGIKTASHRRVSACFRRGNRPDSQRD